MNISTLSASKHFYAVNGTIQAEKSSDRTLQDGETAEAMLRLLEARIGNLEFEDLGPLLKIKKRYERWGVEKPCPHIDKLSEFLNSQIINLSCISVMHINAVNAIPLFILAEKYGLKHIRENCRGYISAHFSVQKCFELLHEKKVLGCKSLVTLCLTIILRGHKMGLFQSPEGERSIHLYCPLKFADMELLKKINAHFLFNFYINQNSVEPCEIEKVFNELNLLGFGSESMSFSDYESFKSYLDVCRSPKAPPLKALRIDHAETMPVEELNGIFIDFPDLQYVGMLKNWTLYPYKQLWIPSKGEVNVMNFSNLEELNIPYASQVIMNSCYSLKKVVSDALCVALNACPDLLELDLPHAKCVILAEGPDLYKDVKITAPEDARIIRLNQVTDQRCREIFESFE